MTEVLHLGAGAKLLWRRGENREPSECENADGKRVPSHDTSSGRLDLATQRKPNRGGNGQRDDDAVPGVLFSDPIHFVMQLSRNGPRRATLTEDAEIRMGEAADVGKDRGQIGSTDAEPGCKRGGKFVDRRRWDPAALAGIVRAVDGERREGAEEATALNCAAHDKLVAAPAVIG